MLFSSIPFLYYFLPVVLIAYFVVPKGLKNTVLLLSSVVFYAWGEKLLVLLFLLSILLGWAAGLLLERVSRKGFRVLILWGIVLYDLGLLGYFKYSDFFIENLNALFRTQIPLLHVIMPIGISFYTFQLLSYDVDVYRRTVPAQKNIIDFAAYVSMFPQLIAGPIVRYADVQGKLKSRSSSLEMVASGVRRFFFGLGKKVLIANVMGEVTVLFRQTSEQTVLYYWMYVICYCLQIYFDFSGYSDMAIGLGRIFGFDFMENFQYPFISSSVTEFWRRWHISLGSWFRDYVYIPLGGNRKGPARQLLNIAVVWMLTGLWHGASWNYVLWGVFYAILLTIEKLGFLKVLDKHKVLGHIYVLLTVIVGFTLFNAPDLRGVGSDLLGLVSFGRIPLVGLESLYYLRSYAVMMLIGIIGATPLPKYFVEKVMQKELGAKILYILDPLFFVLLLILVTAYLVDGSFNPFLYFRF